MIWVRYLWRMVGLGSRLEAHIAMFDCQLMTHLSDVVQRGCSTRQLTLFNCGNCHLPDSTSSEG